MESMVAGMSDTENTKRFFAEHSGKMEVMLFLVPGVLE